MSTKPRSISRQQSKVLFWVQLFLVGLTGLLAAAEYLLIGDGQIWKLFASLFASMIAALAFRLGWLVPCIASGTIIGVILDPLVKGGSLESQLWETVHYIGGGMTIGLVIGILATYSKRGSTG